MERETALSILEDLISKTQNMTQSEFDAIDAKVNYSYSDSFSYISEDMTFGELSFEEVCTESINYNSTVIKSDNYNHSNREIDLDIYLLAA